MSRYPFRAENYIWQCVDMIPPRDARALATSLQALREEDWFHWEWDNREEVVAFLRAEPSTRERKKTWQAPLHRARLALAAHHLGYLGVVVLERATSGFDRDGYREALGRAVDLALSVLERDNEHTWPFACRPPFAHWKALRWMPGEDLMD